VIERRSGLLDRRTGQDRRRPGRPPLTVGERASELNVRLPARLHDRIVQVAARHELSVSELARDLLVIALILYPVNGVAAER
jgi:hypothetical protein